MTFSLPYFQRSSFSTIFIRFITLFFEIKHVFWLHQFSCFLFSFLQNSREERLSRKLVQQSGQWATPASTCVLIPTFALQVPILSNTHAEAPASIQSCGWAEHPSSLQVWLSPPSALKSFTVSGSCCGALQLSFSLSRFRLQWVVYSGEINFVFIMLWSILCRCLCYSWGIVSTTQQIRWMERAWLQFCISEE